MCCGRRAFPPLALKKDLARIESSKSFTRDLLARHKIPGNPFFQRFSAIDGVADVLAKYHRTVTSSSDDGLAERQGRQGLRRPP